MNRPGLFLVIVAVCLIELSCAPTPTVLAESSSGQSPKPSSLVSPAEHLEERRAQLKKDKKILIVVETPAASHINVLLGGSHALLDEGYTISFAYPDYYRSIVPDHP